MTILFTRLLPDNIKGLIKRAVSRVPVRLRMGRRYRQIRDFLREAQWWDRGRIERWQLAKLKEIVKHAYDTAAGYRQLYDEAGVKPADIQTLNDVKRLPFVTKEMIRDNLDDFTSRAVPGWKRVYLTTGGSTGIPFGFYQTKLNSYSESAFMHESWDRVGWKLGDSSAVLRGAFIGSDQKFWKYDPYQRELLLSSYYLTKRTYADYAEKVLRYQPLDIQAYPSAAAMLADLVLDASDRGRVSFRLILLGSENMYDWQKQRLAEAFPEARIFAWYGHAEQAIFAPECEHSEQYHIWPFYGLAEILNEQGNETDEGKVGELIGTSFWSFATPFIRYRTMDMAAKGDFGCDKCGREFQLLRRIEGRLQEIIVTGTGRYISMAAINMHSDVFDNLKQFQFYQDQSGQVTFKIVKKDSYTDKDTALIQRELMKKLGEDMELKIAFVNEIGRTPRGKYRFLEQKLNIKYGQ